MPYDIGILTCMERGFEPGSAVMVREFGGGQLRRRVVQDGGRVVYVCAEAEYVRAQAAGRDPDAIGFPRQCVVPEAADD